MPLSVGTGAGAYAGSIANEPKSKNDIRDTVNRLERQRRDLELQREENSSDITDKRIKDLEDRINNLRSRMDKIKSEDSGECETCENRRYQDGSNDPGVSFKSASKISGNAEAAVRGHEQEHVSRNRAKADREGKEIVYQSVVIKHAICPECGKSYVAGGETTTVTRTKPESEEISPTEKANEGDAVFGKALDKRDEESENGINFVNVHGDHASKQDERFSVGMYDREREVGRFLNIVA